MKKLYIYRYVDLEDVAYYDRVFLYKKDAFNELKKEFKVDFTTDLIIEVVLKNDVNVNHYGILENTLINYNVFQHQTDLIEKAYIIYKR